MFLPNTLLDIVKRMSLFSSVKICDDIGGFFSLFSCVIDFLVALFDYLPFSIPDNIKNFFQNIFNLKHHIIVRRCKEMYTQWQQDKQLISRSSFTDEVAKLNSELKENKCLEDWQRRSNGVKNTLLDFSRLVKSVEAYTSASRIEPSCFTFEGPPGCFKSVLMVKLVKALRLSMYSHITKSSTDGKDFYDTYANETVFTMDDVGQQGISQWRNIINIVSPVRLPLDCAAADLKDTKYFSSEIVVLTTNRFENMQGLTKNDGIDNIEALWRRSYVFDFFKTKRNGRRLLGEIRLKYYDVNTGKWKFGFDADTKAALLLNGYDIPSYISAELPHNQILGWMKVIVMQINQIKKDNYEENDLCEEDIVEVDNCMQMYAAEVDWGNAKRVLIEGVFYSAQFFSNVLSTMKELASDYISSFPLSFVSDIYQKGKEFVMENLLHITCGLAVYGILTLRDKLRPREGFQLESGVQETITKTMVNDLAVHPSVRLVQKQTFDIHLESESFSIDCVGLLSGRQLITVGHASQSKQAYLTVFKNREKNHRLLDNVFVRLAYKDEESDVSVWSLPDNFPTPFKDLSGSFSDVVSKSAGYGSFLLHPQGILDLESIRAAPVEIPTPYTLKLKDKTITNIIYETDIFYKLHYLGLCGSVVVNSLGKVLALHVAGSNDLGVGVALRIPGRVMRALRETVSGSGMRLNVELSGRERDEFSGVKIDENHKVFCPKASHIVESPLHGVFPITRIPAKLSVNGPHTVKDVAIKSFAPVSSVNQDEIEFGKKVLTSIIPNEWRELTMAEVIKGTERLAGINKDSSNGYHCPKDKRDCIDFDKGELKEEFSKDFEKFMTTVHAGDYTSEDVLWYETLKDELRAEDKKLPRSFRVSRLHMQLLTKKIFGGLVEQLVCDRKRNEIMIGVNPFTEWQDIYNSFYKYNKWAGDIKAWDGSMLPQVQHAIYEVLSGKFAGVKSEIDCVLGFLNYCVVAVNDDTYMTTHSMPSGSFLTAMYNSLVNRFYTAMWYYREMNKHNRTPTVVNFEKNVVDYVYGDDKLNAIRDPELLFLNAITMKDFFRSIGMDFTDSKKGEIVEPYQRIQDITFLKRAFVYHKKIKQIVGPLDLNTVFSSISWLDGRKDPEVVMKDKISAFQREMFLHEDLFKEKVELLFRRCEELGLNFVSLSESYLLSLYSMGEYHYLDTLYGIHH
nr:MAG: RNA-dependent RNA polymerase [Crogonang virus 21]